MLIKFGGVPNPLGMISNHSMPIQQSSVFGIFLEGVYF